jgi:hypothetical protein
MLAGAASRSAGAFVERWSKGFWEWDSGWGAPGERV